PAGSRLVPGRWRVQLDPQLASPRDPPRVKYLAFFMRPVPQYRPLSDFAPSPPGFQGPRGPRPRSIVERQGDFTNFKADFGRPNIVQIPRRHRLRGDRRVKSPRKHFTERVTVASTAHA